MMEPQVPESNFTYNPEQDFNKVARQFQSVEKDSQKQSDNAATKSLMVDEQQIGQFVDALFRYADTGNYVSLRAFRENEPDYKKATFKIDPVTIDEGTLDVVSAKAAHMAQQAASATEPVVFCPPIATLNNLENPNEQWRAREQDLAQGLALSVECDQNPYEARDRLEGLLGPATVIVKSGGEWTDPDTGEVQDKLHLHWRLTEPTSEAEDHKALKNARAMATALVGGDATNIPAIHPIRWPGSWHRKGKARLASIAVLNENAEIELADALDKLRPATEEFGVIANPSLKSKDGSPERSDIRNTDLIVHQLITGENYHQSLVALAMRFLKGGMPDGQAVLVIRGLMEGAREFQKGIDGWDGLRWMARYEYILTAVSTARAKLGERNQASELSLMSVSELLQLPPPEYLIENILPDKGVAIMAGKSGDMKSFLAISFAMAVATETNIGDLEVKPGNSLYMMNEGQSGFGLRCEAWLKYHNHQSPDTFKAITMTPNLMRSETVVPFVEVIKREGFRPDFIVLDTFSKAIVGGDDNQTKDVSLALQTAYGLAEEFDALVLIIDHVGKDANRGVRGSYAKYGNVDAVIMVTKSDTIVTAVTKKQKEGEDNLRFCFRQMLVRTKHPLTSDTHEVPVLTPTTVELSQKEFILLALQDDGAQPRKELHGAFVERFGIGAKKSFNTVLERLKTAGAVVETDGVLEVADNE